MDFSFVTGESEPVSKQAGDYLYAGGRWREVYLEVREGRLVETLGPLTDPRLLSDLCSLPLGFVDPGEGQRCEVHLAYHDWLAG